MLHVNPWPLLGGLLGANPYYVAAGGGAWGSITGTLSDQADLQAALDAKQPLDSDLTTIAGLTATTDNFIVSVASAWASRTPAQVRTTLGLVIGTNVQAWDAQLDSLSAASANGVSLVTAADYAAMRALLDLEAGTDFLSPSAIAAAYQPLDAQLTDLAGLSYGGNALKVVRVNAGETAFELATPGGITDGDTLSTGLTFPNTGLRLLDTDASHDLIVKPGSNLSADRTLTVTTGDADRTVTLSANLTVEATATVNQDLTSDADVTFNSVLATDSVSAGTLIATNNNGLFLRDTDDSHYLVVMPGSNLSANRGLTITTGDADRTIDISAGSVTISAAAATVLDDATVAAMVDTLGGASSTGTGGLVRATSPTLVTPALGTPASGSLANCTGYPARTQLTAARTYYVRTDGSDSNDGLTDSSGGAFLTIQKAVDVASALDNGGYDITIQVGDGTYTGAVVCKTFVGSGKIIIQGNNGTPGNVIVSTTSADCFNCDGVVGVYSVRDMELRTTTTGYGLYVAGTPTVLEWQNVRFGTVAYGHIAGSQGAVARATGNYSIVGSPGFQHIVSTLNAVVDTRSRTVTLTGTPALGGSGTAGYDAQYGGLINAWGMTFSGSATGKRYSVVGNAVIFTNGGGASYFPGNSAGSTASGGQYL